MYLLKIGYEKIKDSVSLMQLKDTLSAFPNITRRLGIKEPPGNSLWVFSSL